MANSIRFHGSKLMWFDAAGFIEALSKALKVELTEIRNEVRTEILRQLQAIDFKDNQVNMADGTTVNDRERSAALMASVLRDPIIHDAGKALYTAVYAMRDNFKESHIGWYYEYGTGTKQAEPYPIRGVDGSPRNRLRVPSVGAAIVTRSRFINGGMWRDLGGNMRLSKATRAGVTDEKFLRYIDQETDAEYWFAEGVRQVRRGFNARILKVIKSVPITAHIHLRDFTIGLD